MSFGRVADDALAARIGRPLLRALPPPAGLLQGMPTRRADAAARAGRARALVQCDGRLALKVRTEVSTRNASHDGLSHAHALSHLSLWD